MREGLAVHDPPGAYHVAAVGLADALVAEAYAEDRHARLRRSITATDTPASVRRARAGRNHDPLRREPFDLVDRQRVVALHPHLRAQRLQILHEVEGEAVVVADHQSMMLASQRWPAADESRTCSNFHSV